MLNVAALYHFATLLDPAAEKPALLALCAGAGVKGTLILAREGVNGTIAGPPEGVAAVLAHLRRWPGFADLTHKDSTAEVMPFGRMKVRIKAEIVTMGQPGIDPVARKGHYVAPQDWNALIAQPDVALIDTRNAYEVAIGSFAGAVDPGTAQFRDFPQWWQGNAAQFQGKRIAMFCTGGIRCEKSTNYLLGQGVAQVFHLEGGILKYLEQMPPQDSQWQGECFVFDARVSVTHGLAPGQARMCPDCGRPFFERCDHGAAIVPDTI